MLVLRPLASSSCTLASMSGSHGEGTTPPTTENSCSSGGYRWCPCQLTDAMRGSPATCFSLPALCTALRSGKLLAEVVAFVVSLPPTSPIGYQRVTDGFRFCLAGEETGCTTCSTLMCAMHGTYAVHATRAPLTYAMHGTCAVLQSASSFSSINNNIIIVYLQR